MKWLLAALLAIAPARAGVAPPQVGIDQRIGARLPLELPFRDETDRRERPLGDYFRTGRPAIVVLGYYGCPQLCSVVMNALVDSLTEIQPRAGRDFDVFFVSIDPAETPDLAARKKRGYVRLYGKQDTAAGWHFLTGPAASIGGVSRAIGFRYAYDPALKQFAHASGLTVVTPRGKISRYFYGIEFPAKDLAAALRDARGEREGGPARELLLLCYHYNPISGPYGMAIWRTLQGGALLTLGALGFFIVRGVRREKKEAAR